MTYRLLLTAAAFGFLSVVVPTVSLAQPVDVLIQQGLDLRRQHRDEEALARFQQAWEMSRSAQALAQIALAEQALGRFVQAEQHLSQAINVQADPWINTRRGQLQSALSTIQAQLGTVQIGGGVPGAQVYVNGELRGTLPEAASIRIRAGTAVVELRADGYVPLQRSIAVSAGGTFRESFSLVASASTGGGVAPPPPAGGGGVVVQQGPMTQTQTIETHPNWGWFWLGAIAFVVPWALTGAINAAIVADTTDSDLIGVGFIPVAGPFILLGSLGFDLEIDTYVPVLLVLDGLVQAAGITLAIIGLASTVEEVTVALGDQPDAPRLTVLPSGGSTGAGISLSLTHF